MDPSLSMNTLPGAVDLRRLERLGKLYAAQRASQPLTFHPKDGSPPLRAWALKEAGDGWWDIIVDNFTVGDGTPHRIFETRSRMAGPLDTDVRGLFSVGSPRAVENGVPRLAHGPGPYQIDHAMGGGILGLGSIEAQQLRTGQAQDIAQMLRAPGKMFSRETICAILRGKQAECRSPRRVGQTPDGLLVLAELVDTFENLE